MRFIALQGTYSSLELGIFSEYDAIAVARYDELRASSNLIPFLEALLKNNNVEIKDISFVAVDKGPGAFTSLRATVSSVNGIAFAKNISLIGVNSLEALQVQASLEIKTGMLQPRFIVALLNAYNNDAYFRIFDQESNIFVDEGCLKIDVIVDQLKKLAASVLCVGNGVELYAQVLEDLGDYLILLPKNPAVPSVHAIASIARAQWQNGAGNLVQVIEPYYLKTQLFAIKK